MTRVSRRLMSTNHIVSVRLQAQTREDLDAAVSRIGLTEVSTMILNSEWFADGKLRLYDTPETVEAKARAVRGAVGRFLNGRIVP